MFNILNHLDKLDGVKMHLTWIDAICPVCGGKLKISRSFPKEGSYACYTNYCHEQKNTKGINLIRASLDGNSRFTESCIFKPINLFSNFIALEETPNPIRTEVLDFSSTVPYERPFIKQNTQYRRHVEFDYGEFKCVRVETIDNDTSCTSKYIYPIHKPENSPTYVKGVPPILNFPIYRKDYISKDLVVVEGEKCASFLQKLGISAVCIYTPYSSSYALDRVMSIFKDNGVSNLVYLPDNDKPGYIKAKKFLQSAWKHGLYANSIDFIKFYPEYSDCSGFDIVDLYLTGHCRTQESILKLIDRGIHE